MAKSLLLNVLCDVLGNYVEGLSRENLKVAVWSGTIDLSNLKLKGTALDNLNLPIKVERGYLKKLHLKIPWASLESKSVVVELDGIYLQASPLDMANLSAEDAQRMVNASNMKKLLETENGIITMVQKKENIQDTAKKATYVQQLTAKIIDNLEVSITNLHVRYEDSTSIPGSVFSCGFTIEKLCLTTTDETWTSRFVSRDMTTRKETAIHKLGTMENFGVYWNKSSTQLSLLRYDEWEAHMFARIFHSPPSEDGGEGSISPRSPSFKKYVTSPGPSEAESMGYLLAPPNIFSMKVAHREVCTETHPKLDVVMDSTVIPFSIQSDQYQQLKLVSQEFKDMDRRRLLITHRPQLRPSRAPREWWFYAYSLITGRNLNNGKGKLQLLSECVRAKRIYVPYHREKLVRREIIEPLLVGNEGDQQQYASTHATEETMMQKYRDTLPLATLLAFHEIAAKEAVVEILKLRADSALLKAFIEKNVPAGKAKATGETKSFWGGSTTKAATTATAGSSPREPAKASGGGIFGSWFGRSKAKTPPPVPTTDGPTKAVTNAAATAPPPDNLSGAEMAEDEQSMQDLEATLAKFSQEAAAAADDLFTLRVLVSTSTTVSIIHRRQPVAYMDMSMRSKMEMRRGNICVLFEVDKLSIQDSISENPIHTHLLSMIDAEQGMLDGAMETESSFQVPRIDLTETISSPITVSTPKFCLAFESNTNGQSTLKIRSCPVQIVLNEPCVRGLMSCFASPISKYTAEAPLLFTSMNAISSRIALPEKAGMEIDMEIYAPTIIIPEEFDADTGCVQLDTGKLIVHGSIVPGEMNWDVVVRAVNISMPRDSGSSSGKDRRLLEIMKSGTAEDHYLITPFDVKVKVRMSPEAESDIVVAVEIAPYIEGKLDALKLVRLKYIIDLVVRSLQPLPASSEEDDESEAGFVRTSSQQLERDIYESDNPTSISTAKPLAIPYSSWSDVDYKRVKMTLQVALPRLAMVLSIASDHTAELTVSAIDLTVVKRAGDMNVQISAEGMALTDSQRPPNHRAILWTVQESEEKAGSDSSVTDTQPTAAVPLLKVAYRSLNTPLSPLYNGNQTELSIACNTLQCGVDDVATMRYVPFAASFMEHYQKYYGTATTDEVASSAITARRQQQQPPTVLPFGGTLIVFSVSRVSLDILHCPAEDDSSIKKSETTAAAVAAQGQVRVAKGVCLESAFSTEVREIFVQYATNQTSNEVTAYIGTVDVKDVRTSSQSFVYNTLFTRSTMDSSIANPENNNNHANTSLSEYSDKIISVKYTKQLDTLQSGVEVFLQDITSYVSVDIIMAFVELILANITSMNAILAAINGEQDITEIVMRRIKQLQSAAAASGNQYNSSLATLSQTNIDEIQETMDVTVTVVNPRLLLLEDPSDSSSKAIVSDCHIHFHLSQTKLTAKKAKRFDVTDTFHCSLQKAQVFVVSDVSTNANPHKIIAPTGLDIHAKRHSENGVMLTSSLNVGSEPIACRVSLNDVVLTNSIIGRAKLTKRQGKREDVVVVDPTNKPRTSAPTQQLTLLTVQLNFATVSVVLLNDYHQVNIPMFRIALDQLSYSSSGAIGMMEGEGSMLVNADFYNTTVAMWEPVLEPWVPTIKVHRDTEGTEVSLNSRGVLQVNVSGAMCNGIYTCLALISKIGQEGVTGERVKVDPWVVRNYLGIPLELFDSRSNDSIGVLMDDQVFVIPPKKADPKVRKQGSYSVHSYPDLFELRLVDSSSVGERVPITQIPTRTVRSRLYHFLPVHTGTAGSVAPKAKKNLQSEPIIEEVFENQRYYPMKFSWGEPWSQMGDPSKWTNSRGQSASDPAGYRLPGDWEWVDPSWKVEVGKVGVETDGDGWFYSPAFSTFTASRKQRRAQQPLDVVRRRRLTRTRAQPRNTSIAAASSSQDSPTDRSAAGNDHHSPIPVYWDVVAKSDEASEILITSGMQFVNNAPCAVEVQMLDALSSDAAFPFSVQPNGTLHLPYSVVHCNCIRIRPLNLDFTWSAKIPCKLKSEETTPQLHTTNSAVCTKPNFGAYNMTVHVLQRDKRITMTCSGCAQFYNLLPCKLSVLLSLRDSGLDTSVLEPGVAFGVTRVPMEAHTEITFAIGEFASVHPVRVSQLRAAREVVVWLHNRDNVISGDAEPDLMSITLITTMTLEGVLEIRALSQYLLVDQSDTAVLVRSDTSELSAPATSHAGAASDFVIRRSYQHERKYTRKPIVEQIMAMEDISMESCWVEGVGGVTMFQAGGENKISLGVSRGNGLLRDVSLDGLTAEKAPVEIVDPESKIAYNLALTLCPMPGPLSATRLLRVMPAYTIVNYLDEAVDLLHPTDKSGDHKDGFRIEAKSARTWHRPSTQPGTAMRLRSSSTAPSLGLIDVNELGASLLLLPRNDADAAKRSSFIVAHVEVKFSDPSEASYITVVIWRAKVRKISANAVDNSTAMLSVKNETDYVITVAQEGAGAVLQTVTPAVAKKCELMLQPAEWSAYGWVDGSIGSELNVAVTNNVGSRASCVINTLLVNSPQHIGNLITMTVRTLGNGKVLFVSKYDRDLANLQNEQQIEAARSGAVSPTQSLAHSTVQASDRSKDLILKLRLQSVGLSLVAESPVRRELFSAYVENVVSVMRRVPESGTENAKATFDLKVKDIHIDNYTDTAVYPVLMNSINSDERLEAEKQRKRKSSDATSSSSDKLTSLSSADNLGETGQEYCPFLRFSMAWEQSRGHQAVLVKYLAVRILELKVAVDTSTLYIYFLDLHKDLVQQPVFIDSADPRGLLLYLEDFNAKALDTQLYHVNGQDACPETAFLSAQRHKYYFEALIIHPIKITLTFTPTSLSAKRNAEILVAFGGNNPLRLLPRIAAVEDFAVKISSFIVDHALESQRSMRQRIVTKTVLDLKAQMLQIAGNLVGSMTLLGKPAGLYKNIGSGVSDFFYEPFLGIMESPQAFVLGLGKGTGSLLGGVATGVIGSAANLVGTATTGVSTLTESVANLSGDDKYMQRREEKLRAAKAGQGGVFSGLKSGGESMFTGVASGLSGLVTKPYQEGKKSGALGVVKGMGMGIIGAATKPVMGVTDGLSSIATGFSQQMQDPLKIVSHIRPARAFEKTEDKDDAPPALCKFDLFAAEAQHYVRRRAIIKTYNDEYLASCPLGFPKNGSRPPDALFGVALSKQYIFLLSGTMHKDWKITWAELSHVALEVDATSGAVDFVSYAGASWAGDERGNAPAAGQGDGQSRRIQCANRASAIKLYSTLVRFAYRMGNPAAVLPLEDHLAAEDSYSGPSGEAAALSTQQQGLARRSSIGSASATGSYKFGMANKRENRCGTMSEAQIFANMRLNLEKMSLGMLQEQGGADRYHKLLDEATWKLICMWRSSHHLVFNPSRCAACLIVNNSPHYVQVMDFELKEGKDYVILGVGEGYDKDSRSLVAAGGAAIVFAFGYVPSLTDLAHVKLRLFTSAFSAVISTRRNRSDIANQSGFHAGYVEKVQADYWTKSVIVIN